MKSSQLTRLVLTLVLILGMARTVPGAENPKLLPFQGRLTDPAGNAISNGARLVQFRLCDTPSGGSVVWAGEIHRATVNGGLVNVMLGTATPLDGVDFNQQLHLEITVDGNGDNAITAADPPLLPRQLILPAIFARESHDTAKLAGRDWSALLANGNDPGDPSSSLRGDKLEPASLTVEKLAQTVREKLFPPGSIVAAASGVVPSGWLACNGSVVSRADYPRLFDAIGINWGAGDLSSTFHLPDLRGQFLRGDSQGNTALDPDWFFGRSANHPGGATHGVGSYQYYATARPRTSLLGTGNQSQPHTHTYYDAHFAEANFAGAGNQGLVGSSNGFDSDNGVAGVNRTSAVGNEAHTHTIISGGDNESRPRNAAVLYIVKY